MTREYRCIGQSGLAVPMSASMFWLFSGCYDVIPREQAFQVLAKKLFGEAKLDP